MQFYLANSSTCTVYNAHGSKFKLRKKVFYRLSLQMHDYYCIFLDCCGVLQTIDIFSSHKFFVCTIAFIRLLLYRVLQTIDILSSPEFLVCTIAFTRFSLESKELCADQGVAALLMQKTSFERQSSAEAEFLDVIGTKV